jgi:hypothetical protein
MRTRIGAFIVISTLFANGCATIAIRPEASAVRSGDLIELEMRTYSVPLRVLGGNPPSNVLTLVGLDELRASGEAELVNCVSVLTVDGLEATVKGVAEIIYPSGYSMNGDVERHVDVNVSVQSAGQPPDLTPQQFETREVGSILSVLPERDLDPEKAAAGWVWVTLTPETVFAPSWLSMMEPHLDSDAAKGVRQPVFRQTSVSTSIMIQAPGCEILYKSPDPRDESHTLIVTLSVSIKKNEKGTGNQRN